jgi:tight adherence protein C
MKWNRLPWLTALTTALASIACVVTAAPASADDSRIEVLEVRADAFPRISVRFNALGADGLPLDGLTAEQVQVLEEGQVQSSAEVRALRNPTTPTSVMLAIDVSGSMADDNKLGQAQAAAKSFLDQMRRRDKIGVLSFGTEVKVPQMLSNDRKRLTGAIDGLVTDGNTRLYDGLAQSLTQLAIASPGARAVVLLTDGRDTGSERGIDDVVRQAARMGAPVYTIGLGTDVDSEVLRRIAHDTGGRYYAAPTGQELTQVFRLISHQLTSQYEVTWHSSRPAGGDVPAQIMLQPRDASPVQASISVQVPAPSERSTRATDNTQISPLASVVPVEAPDPQRGMLAGILAGAAALALFLGLARGRVNRGLEARLSTFVAGKPEAAARRADPSRLSTRRAQVNPVTWLAARFAARLVPGRQVQRLRRKLGQAGHPSERHLALFLATELALALLLGSAGYAILELRGLGERAPVLPLLIAAMLVLLGLYMPYMWLRRRVEWRQRTLVSSLPDALDLMSIAVSAGLSLDSAMQEVVQKWEGELSRELNQLLNEMQLGVTRRQALLNLVERTQLDDLRLLVAALIQADELGANLSETLGVQAAQLRVRRRQKAEEKARKAPVKMLIPLVGLIFPAMFVVLLAPAVMQFLNALRGMVHHG